jgi:solute carrier family 25 phosphate transporter 23/24/25/41
LVQSLVDSGHAFQQSEQGCHAFWQSQNRQASAEHFDHFQLVLPACVHCRMFVAGGTAGAVARTCTAPLDRIKLLFQVQAVPSAGTSATAYTGLGQAFRKILAEEGVRAFWKGNGLNIIRWVVGREGPGGHASQCSCSAALQPSRAARPTACATRHPCSIFPYSAAQLSANDHYKRLLADERGELTVPQRLLSGACAGMTATALTHPLDTIRLRMALPNHGYRGARGGGLGRSVCVVSRHGSGGARTELCCS